MGKMSLKEMNFYLKKCGIGFNQETIEYTPLLGVHHQHEWDYGYESGIGFSGPRRIFYADMYEMIRFLNCYFKISEVSELIVAPFYRYNQFDKRYYTIKNKMPGVDIFDEIRTFLKRNGIKKGERTGIKLSVDEGYDDLAMIIEGSFRGVSELCLFSIERQVLIVPNHHFDLAFFTNNIVDEKEKIRLLLRDFPVLRYYEKLLT